MEIKGKFDHYNFNVINLERSMEFYEKALGFTECKRIEADDSSFIIVYLCDKYNSDFLLELTWLRDRKEPYSLGDCEFHLCVRTDGDYDEVRKFHREMDCVCYENEKMSLYFISDPDGYWIEILPLKSK
ncbi:MAG: VOC family protein [Prevotellaceae bacterium]|jgi:lactoylglutathione lyase|nr:VOC family protein [Prevotellaceae bacterium]